MDQTTILTAIFVLVDVLIFAALAFSALIAQSAGP